MFMESNASLLGGRRELIRRCVVTAPSLRVRTKQTAGPPCLPPSLRFARSAQRGPSNRAGSRRPTRCKRREGHETMRPRNESGPARPLPKTNRTVTYMHENKTNKQKN